jgi:DNA-binding IclR family transcriptional regulator
MLDHDQNEVLRALHTWGVGGTGLRQAEISDKSGLSADQVLDAFWVLIEIALVEQTADHLFKLTSAGRGTANSLFPPS